ncbi:hypothetical protein C5N14_28045 [Micromonospora sp. MW-13]|nr:hypothetical protein C5N14_28045 [Micromonospora sp. MW-13]
MTDTNHEATDSATGTDHQPPGDVTGAAGEVVEAT